MAKFLETHAIFSEITSILDTAKRFVYIVSPYIELSTEQKLNFKGAAERNIKIVIAYREEENCSPLERESLSFLKRFPNTQLIPIPDLHAKIYANENEAILSSRNLTNRKEGCSIEVGVVFDNTELIYNNLIKTVERLKEYAKVKGISSTNNEIGYCIRCGRPIPYDCSHPLCWECYQEWSLYGNEEYQERFCHKCGRETYGITFRKPVEPRCYSLRNDSFCRFQN